MSARLSNRASSKDDRFYKRTAKGRQLHLFVHHNSGRTSTNTEVRTCCGGYESNSDSDL
jgi:hypothetical protein